MQRKKTVLFSVIAFVAIALLLCLVLLVNEKTYEPAASVDELMIGVDYGGKTEEIKIWKRPAGENEISYFFFLPSDCKGQKITFLNIPKEGILLGETTVTLKTDLTRMLNGENSVYTIDMGDGSPCRVEFLQSANLGAFYITTESGSVDAIHADKNVREKGRITAIDENGSVEYDGKLDFIKCRGSGSFLDCEKKSYTIKLPKEISLLGISQDRKWILQANAYDDSRIKNKLAYDFAKESSSVLASESEYFDLYINGEYMGNYLLCRPVDVMVGMEGNSNLEERNEAVNSEESIRSAKTAFSKSGNAVGYFGLNSPDDITGGYIIELTLEPLSPCYFITDLGCTYEIVYPENATLEEVSYIKDYMNDAEKALASSDGINPETGKYYTEYIDVESWAQKNVMEELFNDVDKTVNHRSVFFYKFSDSVDGHIYAGPVWDFDSAFGESPWTNDLTYFNYPNSTSGEGLLYADYILEKEEIKTEMNSFFKDVAAVYVDDRASAEIRKISTRIKPSLELEETRWPEIRGRYESKQAQWDYIYRFLTARKDFLEDVWINEEIYHTVEFIDYGGTVIERYKIKHGEPITKIPDVSSWVAVFAGWRFGDNDRLLVEGMPILEDVTFRSTWIDMDIIAQNMESLSGIDWSAVDLEHLKALIEAAEEIQKAETGNE